MSSEKLVFKIGDFFLLMLSIVSVSVTIFCATDGGGWGMPLIIPGIIFFILKLYETRVP